jgi:hypothetical protein
MALDSLSQFYEFEDTSILFSSDVMMHSVAFWGDRLSTDN